MIRKTYWRFARRATLYITGAQLMEGNYRLSQSRLRHPSNRDGVVRFSRRNRAGLAAFDVHMRNGPIVLYRIG